VAAAAASKKAQDIKKDEEIRKLLDEAEKMGREFSVLGAAVS